MKTPSLSEIQPDLKESNHQTSSPKIAASTTSSNSLSTEDSALEPPAASNVVLSTNISKRDNSHAVAFDTSSLEAALVVSPARLPADAPDALNDVVEIYLQQADAYCEESQWDKAIAACKEAIEVAPEAAAAYRRLGNILQRQGKLTDAMGFYAKALVLQPGAPEIYSNLGILHARKQDWDKAIAYFQKAIEKDPQLAGAYNNLAKVWKKQGQPERELACLQTALQLQPELGPASSHYRVGEALEAKEDIEAAIAFYRQAIEQSPDFLPAYERLVELLEDRGDWESAIAYYRKVVDLTAQATHPTPTDRQAANGKASKNAQSSLNPPSKTRVDLSKRGQQYVQKLLQASSTKQRLRPAATKDQSLNNRPPNQQGQDKTSVNLSKHDQQYVQKLLQASSTKQRLRPAASVQTLPKQESAPVPPAKTKAQQVQKPVEQLSEVAQLGLRYANAQDWPQATHYLRQAVQAEPQSAVLYRTIATVLARGNQSQQAALAWYKAFTLDPDWPNAQQYLRVGSALFEQGKQDAAADCYKQAIRRQPTLSAAYRQLADLLRSQNRPEMAAAVLRRLEAISVKQIRPQNGAAADIPALLSRNVEQALKFHQQGEALRKQNQWELAIEAYRKAIGIHSTFSWSHHSLGDCYKKLGSWPAAATAYQKAIKLKPDFVWSYYSLAEVAEAQQDWTAAANHYRSALSLDPANAQVPPRLCGVLQQLIEQAPRNIDYYRELAELQAAQRKKDEAIATYQMALQIRPDEATIALALSKLIAKQDPQKAHALIDRALSHTVTNQDIQSYSDLQTLETTAALLSATHLFDPRYYRATNPDLAIDDDRGLLLHYLRQGSADRRNPNPLFDEAFYRDRHPELAEKNINSLAHFHRFGYPAGEDPHPFFNIAFYCETHPDVAAAEINPLEHYLAYGAKEGRAAFSPEQLSHIIEQPTPTEAEYLTPWLAAKDSTNHSPVKSQRLAIYVNSQGNYFITEIADFIAAALQQAGHTVIQLTEQDTPPEELDGHWVVAPHEFFYLGDGPQWAQRPDWLSQAVFVNVEQPQTTWFSKAFHFLRHAKAIFDINVKSTAILRSLHLPAYWLPLGYLPQYAEVTASEQLPDIPALKSLPATVSDRLPDIDAPLLERSIDLHFIGTLNPRREQFFAESASWLSQFHNFLHIPPMGVPLLKGQEHALDSSVAVGLSRRSKILLNIHRDELPYFEWHRIVFHGLWQNTLVVTEPCHNIPGLTAGEHFIECSLADMPSKIESLLNDPLGQSIAEKVRRAGHQAIKEQFNGAAIANSALQIAQQKHFFQPSRRAS